jgi:hypothetical protein
MEERMLGVQHSLKAEAYRRKAARCDSYAGCARSSGDRGQLLRMRDSLLALAATEEWLDGLPPTSPAKALAVPVSA